MSTPAALLLGWELEPVPAAGVLVAGAGYLLGVRRIARRAPHQPWPVRRTVLFLAGLVAVALATLGPPAFYDDTFFWAHMTQHILLMMVAAPLLVLGDPVLLALRAAGRDLRHRLLVPVLRSRALHGVSHPAVGWSVLVGVTVLSHLPAVYDFALERPLVHDYVEHPVYLGAALLFFFPLLAPTAGPRHVPAGIAVLALFGVMLPTSAVGFFIYAAPHVTYPFYAHVDRPFGPGALADQQLAGALMWSTAMGLSALWVCVAGARFLREEEARGRRVNRAAVGWSA